MGSGPYEISSGPALTRSKFPSRGLCVFKVTAVSADISGLSWLHEACCTLFGPYQIIEKVGSIAYKLALPLGSQIHNVFHVSLLRKHLGSVPLASPRLPPVSETSTLLPQPEAILDRRVIRKGTYRPKPQILVKRAGAPVEDATWETEWRFAKTYPDCILEDKDIVSGGE